MDEEVFRALADPSRRALLDALRERDGQALSELEEALPGMTRFGVMKHLRVLADATLITTRRDGRRKLHYLNAVPIRLIYERWVSRYTEPWAAALTGLKRTLEEPMEKVYEIYIKTTPERLWEAITDPEQRSKYNFGSRQRSDWTPGSRVEVGHPAAPTLLGEGENLEVDPPRRLVQSMRALWSEEVKKEGFSRVTWEIEPVGDSCRLIVTHDQLREGANEELYGGWPMILSGLKTWLETGELLTTPGSLMYAAEERNAAPEDVYQVEIATTPERLWQALTDPDETRRYWYGALSISDWQVGSRWISQAPDGEVYLEGEILEIDPPRRLVHTFHVVHEPEAAAEAPSRIEFEITQVGDRCRLTVIHSGRGPATIEYTSGGWETIFAGLKELLETGSVVAAGM